jgi:hypothetical protein
MKNVFSFKSLSIILSLATAFAITQSCGTKADLTKDFAFNLDLDIIKVPLSLQIIDGNFDSGASPEGVTIELAGPDKDKFYSTIGEKKLTVTKGFVDFAIKKTDAPTVQNPLSITVIAKAPGYLRTIRTFTLTTADSTQFQAMSMVNLAKPPAGVTIQTASVKVGANGTVAATTLATTPVSSQEAVNVQIPAGTLFKDKDGNVLTGTAEATLVHFDNRNPASLAAFPGGFAVGSAKDANGANIGSGQFTTMGFLALDMTIGGKEVKNFSGAGIQISMDLNESSVNPVTGAPIAIGDSMPIWSLNETDNSWVREQVGVVSGTAGNLKLVYTQKHLSYWNLDYFYGPSCNMGGTITFAGIPTANYYYMEVLNAVTNQVVQIYHNYIYLSNGSTFNFFRAPDFPVYIKLYSGTAYYCKGAYLGKSNTFSLCGAGTATFVLGAGTPPAPTLTTTVSAVGTCASKPGIAIYPNVTVYYHEVGGSGCNYWSFGGTMLRGQYITTVFQAGKTYDILIIVGGVGIVIQKTIPANAVGAYKVDMRALMPEILCSRF